MTDFCEGIYDYCRICGVKFYQPEGPMCDCWQCTGCKEWFSDHDMLGNGKLWLCLFCEDERYKTEEGEINEKALQENHTRNA